MSQVVLQPRVICPPFLLFPAQSPLLGVQPLLLPTSPSCLLRIFSFRHFWRCGPGTSTLSILGTLSSRCGEEALKPES